MATQRFQARKGPGGFWYSYPWDAVHMRWDYYHVGQAMTLWGLRWNTRRRAKRRAREVKKAQPVVFEMEI